MTSIEEIKNNVLLLRPNNQSIPQEEITICDKKFQDLQFVISSFESMVFSDFLSFPNMKAQANEFIVSAHDISHKILLTSSSCLTKFTLKDDKDQSMLQYKFFITACEILSLYFRNAETLMQQTLEVLNYGSKTQQLSEKHSLNLEAT
ncbi:hypothetical protein AB837_00403 [bacterium AB1]|nr:hypothetical protein AB837_00403 [bacterium AB1]